MVRVKTIALNSPYQKRAKGKRTKSQRDLANQMYRIVHLSKNPDNDPRVDRAIDIADRYQGNMMATRQRVRDTIRVLNAMRSGNKAEEDKARRELVDRQYSRHVYMGLNNG